MSNSEQIKLRDTLYGNVYVSPVAAEILDSTHVQRLRNIKQLGLSHLVYNGATHTRLDHTIGVYHIASRLAESVGLSEQQRMEVELAALLHDTGHGPFSHVSERVVEGEHETVSCEIVDTLLTDYDVDTQRVKDHITGASQLGLIAGTIDADRIDYLRRDAHNAGPRHGEIDTEPLVDFATVVDDTLAFDYKALQALESTLLARSHMINSVYMHHTTLIAETMLERAIELYVKANPSVSIHQMNDAELQVALTNSDVPEVKQLATSIFNTRELYKRAAVLGLEDMFSRSDLKTLERVHTDRLRTRLSDEAGVPEAHILVNRPSTPNHDRFDVPIVNRNNEVVSLSSLSSTPEAALETRWRNANLGIYAPQESVSVVSDAVECIDFFAFT